MSDPGQSSRPDVDGKGWSVETLYEHFKLWLTKSEKHYDDRFDEIKDATNKALASVREQTEAAFKANEKAIEKAEKAQTNYNERSNEFRGQLDDQAKRLMAREEALTKFSIYDEKIEDLKRDISKLREAQMEVGGRRVQQQENRQQTNWTIGQAITIALVIAGFVVGLIEVLIRK